MARGVDTIREQPRRFSIPVPQMISKPLISIGTTMAIRSTARLLLIPACVGILATINSIIRIRKKRIESIKETEKNDNELEKKTGRRTLQDTMEQAGGSLTIQPVGVVRSIYRLCVGTPRQGLLAPHARGCIELTLDKDAAADAVKGLEDFSHIWIIFIFHLNTVSKNGRVPAKIAPPALGGRKVGVFASRAPHRFNPVGITLAKLDGIRVVQKHVSGRNKPVPTVCLDISGLDLVDGTPVVDIKPYVPTYDAPSDDYNLPGWVSGGLKTQRAVCVTASAQQDARRILEQDSAALDFYGGPNESTEDALEGILACIREVLAMDVRSQWQTKKARQGKSQAERAIRLHQVVSNDLVPTAPAVCTQQIDNLLIYYTVAETTDTGRPTSEGSGAEDAVTVTSIQLIS